MGPYRQAMARRSNRQEIGSLAALLEPTRDRLYRHISAQDRPVTRDDAAAATGISRAMAAFHLDKLVEAGLLRARYRRLSGRTGRGAGRPAKLYARSKRRFAVSEPRTDHELLGRLLAKAVQSRAVVEEVRGGANRYGRLLGARAAHRLAGRESEERLAGCLADVLAEVGFAPTRTHNQIRAGSVPSTRYPRSSRRSFARLHSRSLVVSSTPSAWWTWWFGATSLSSHAVSWSITKSLPGKVVKLQRVCDRSKATFSGLTTSRSES